MTLGRRSLLVAAGLSWAVQAQQEVTLEHGGARITLQLEPGFDASQRQAVFAWVASAAQAVVGYLGRFPVRRCELLIQRTDGAGVKGGTTFAEPELFIRIRLGSDTADRHLADDWVLVHEMVHLAVPRVPRAQSWLQEGLATYVEGVARVHAGITTAQRLWAEMLRSMPQGQPAEGDCGLDHTPTWGRTYWGGALFCLQADVLLLQRSGTKAGLREALRGVLAAGGSYAVAWPVRRILAVGDRAVQQVSLVPLYESLKDTATPADLDALWLRLGVSLPAGEPLARFDDDAPLAAVRRAIA